MRVVIDTNVIVSALIVPGGQEALVLLLALRRQFEMYVSPAVLAEYHDVLRRPRFKRLKTRDVEAALVNIRKVARSVHPTRTLKVSSHESDNRFYECAAAADADYLVTGNRRHFLVGYGDTKIVTSRKFLEIIAAHQPSEEKSGADPT